MNSSEHKLIEVSLKIFVTSQDVKLFLTDLIYFDSYKEVLAIVAKWDRLFDKKHYKLLGAKFWNDIVKSC